MRNLKCRPALAKWCAGAALLWTASAAAGLPPGAAAEILNLQGGGDHRAASALEWMPANVSQALVAGAYVRTRESSRMALLFADQTQVRLHQNTVLQVKGVASAAQPLTSLVLEVGRAWAQTRRPAESRLNLQTPVATVGIRGTDWDIEVDPDGRTLLTVLSGRVTLSNEHGEIVVSSNEAALAEAGKAPVRLQLTQPRDRVQWVNALLADPLRHLPALQVPAVLASARIALARRDEPGLRRALAGAQGKVSDGWLAVFDIAQEVIAGRLVPAQRRLATLTASGDAPAAGYSMLAELQLVGGDSIAAMQTLAAALMRWPGTPELRARLAHTQLMADRVDESAVTLGRPAESDPADLWLARGELARRQGQARPTLEAYMRAIRLAPEDDRGWFGLGSAQTEREDSVPARANLLRAIELDPHGPGYLGELGTLEAYRNDLVAAESAFAGALKNNAADYVALTGLGLLRLKQGQPQSALDALLRAGVMEPRYARAKTYTGVAYYQLRRHQDAIATLQQAALLDDKDPLPHLFLAQIYTDLYRAGDAVTSSQAALRRMPYVKSLNQVANDQLGRANLGASLAFFGLREWATELAQQAALPYWGASHLFLADRYMGEFVKNSELFQGFLTDPLAFGGSPGFTSLVQSPGDYGTAALTLDRQFHRSAAPSVALNGLRHAPFPVAYFVKAQAAAGRDYPIDIASDTLPAHHDPTGGVDSRLKAATIGLGARPSENLGVFAYLNDVDLVERGRNRLLLSAEAPSATRGDSGDRKLTAGGSYRWSPASQTWIKLGYSSSALATQAVPYLVSESWLYGLVGANIDARKRLSELQLRHTADLANGGRWSFVYEHVKERQSSLSTAAGPVTWFKWLEDGLAVDGVNDIDRRFTAVTLAAEYPLSATLRLDGMVTANWTRHRVHGARDVRFDKLTTASYSENFGRDDTERVLAPRLGLVWQPSPSFVLRAAHQDWVRPASVGSLSPVDTAGIPVEDRVQAGGRVIRNVLQLGWTVSDRTFITAKIERLRGSNPVGQGVDLRTPAERYLEELRNSQLTRYAFASGTPDLERARLRSFTLYLNQVFNSNLSGHGGYEYLDTDSWRMVNSSSAAREAWDIATVARHTLIAGGTWISHRRLNLGGRFIYQSERFEDKQNLLAIPAGGRIDLFGYWESADKHWMLRWNAERVVAKRTARQRPRYTLHAVYRF